MSKTEVWVEEDRVGCGSIHRRRKDHGIRDPNHHRGDEQDVLGLPEDALCPADRSVRETASAPWHESEFRSEWIEFRPSAAYRRNKLHLFEIGVCRF